MQLSPAEHMTYSATRIVAEHVDHSDYGAGFLRGIDFGNDRHGLFLVTNNHVVETAVGLMFEVHESHVDYSLGPTGNTLTCRFTSPESLIVRHPDASVDLCFINLAPVSRGLELEGKHVFSASFTRDNIPREDEWNRLDAFEDIIMIGCPNGLYDEVNHVPVVRRGITASHPARNYEGATDFLVDIARLGGYSGLPIFLYGTSPRFDRETGEFTLGSIRFGLLELPSRGPQFTYEVVALIEKD